MLTNEFKTYHPIVNFVYFIFVTGFSMFFMHPFCLSVSLICGLAYLTLLKGKKSIKNNLLSVLSTIAVMGIINPLFNHQGITVVAYFPNGNPLTLQSIIYGISAAVMISSVICHFSCYNQVMTEDKFIYLFGRAMPSLSLMLSMTLRFVPRLAEQFRVIAAAQKCVGNDISKGKAVKRAKSAAAVFSVMISRSLEGAINTADSMKSRGYGLKGRTAFSIFYFDKRDKKALICILASGFYVLIGGVCGGMEFRYFPSMQGVRLNAYSISVFAAYMILCLVPIIIEIREVKKWRSIKSVI